MGGYVFQDKKGRFEHQMCLKIRVGSIVQFAIQEVERASEADVPILREVVFGKVYEIGKIFRFLVGKYSATYMILERFHEPQRYILADVDFETVVFG